MCTQLNLKAAHLKNSENTSSLSEKFLKIHSTISETINMDPLTMAQLDLALTSKRNHYKNLHPISQIHTTSATLQNKSNIT